MNNVLQSVLALVMLAVGCSKEQEDEGYEQFKAAVERGDPEALTELGMGWLERGDLPEAAHYFGEAAEQGHEKARVMIEHYNKNK